MAVATGILFARAGVGRNVYDPLYEMRLLGDAVVALAAAAGIPYQDVAMGSVSESGAKTAAALQDYNLFVHTGHGSQTRLSGDYASGYQSIIDKADADSLDLIDGRAVYALACQAGADLLTSIVTGVSGRVALASAGYNDNYGFVIAGGGVNDIYFVSTMAPGFKFIESAIEDNAWSDCYDDALAEFDTQIAYWETGDGADIAFASETAATLTMTKSRLVKFGDNTWKLSGDTSPSVGTIAVTTNHDSATFGLAGAATYSGSGTSWSESSATPGQYTITYGDLNGYVTPPAETKTLVAGATITFSGVYTPVAAVGIINVSCNIASAYYDIIGPVTYTGSGATYENTAAVPGSYRCVFGMVDGYVAPAAQTRYLHVGGEITFTGEYVEGPTRVITGIIDPDVKIATVERMVQQV